MFGGLEGRSLNSVLGILKPETFRAGSTVFKAGELGRTVYVIRSGEVEVHWTSSQGTRIPMFRLGPGECFGEMALVEQQPRSATVCATQDTKLYSLTNVDLYRLFKQDNFSYLIILQNICRILSRRLRKADTRLCDFLAALPLVREKAGRRRIPPPRARKTARRRQRPRFPN
jgi:CRP-like cAMP-binding protein